MKFFKKGAILFLVIGLLANMFTFGGIASTSTTIENLKVNDFNCPIGIDKTPTFSWQMVSDIIGQKQTAYQIIVSENENFSNSTWDSGKVMGDVSINLPYGGTALKASTRYFWKVAVWDKSDVKIISTEKAYFETGLLGSNVWNGSNWIKTGDAQSKPENSTKTTNYTLEADIQVVNTGVALLFEAQDDGNFLMWQFRTKDGRFILKPHYRKNTNFTVLSETDITDKVNGDITSVQHVKLVVTDESVNTYLNDNLISTIQATQLGGVGLTGTIGKVGYRSDYFEKEDGFIDNIFLKDFSENQNGIIVKDYDFDDDVNPFTAGSVVDGRLKTTYTDGAESVSLEKSDLKPIKYSVEADITCSDSAVTIVFSAKDKNSFYMWQFNTKEQAGKVLFRPHTCINGSFAVLNNNVKDVTSNVGGVAAFATDSANIKIDVTETTIKTYINSELVDTYNVQSTFIPVIGKIGTRTSLTETGTIDNLKLTDYLNNVDGNVVYNYTFDSINPFYIGSIANGVYIANGDRGVILPEAGVDTFRKEFTPKSDLKSAKIYMTGLGVFDAYINGQRIGTLTDDNKTVYDELKPGYTQPDKRVFYYTYDITDLVDDAEVNTISATVSPGWWCGRKFGKKANTAFRAKILLSYTDGTTETIGTDTTWKSSNQGPILKSDIFDGETYDANADVSYRNSGYDDSSWYYSAVDKQFNGQIVACTGAQVRVRDDLELQMKTATIYNGIVNATSNQFGKINITQTKNQGEVFELKKGETAIIDLGQNFAGWGEITAVGAKGTIITMRHSEMLNDNNGLKSRGNDGAEGSIYTANLRSAQATARYIMSGNTAETYRSSHTFYGFRYMEITTSEDITVNSVKGIVITSALEDVGEISTDKELINKLISNIKWGQYSNYLSIPTDCPQRDERQGWTADTQVFSTAAAYNADSKNFLRKYMQDLRDAQIDSGRYNGAYPDTAPYTGYGEIGQLGWTDTGVIIPYNLYKMYGDKSIIQENYAAMKKFLDVFMATTNKNGGEHNHGDWLAYESNDSTIKNMLGVAYYAWDAQMMSEMAAVLGNANDVTKYNKLYQTEKDYFISKYVKADGSLTRKEQSVNLMALKLDLLPNEASRAVVKNTLLENIAKNGNKLQTGFLGTAVLMQTLSDIGASDVAYKLLTQEGNPSWLYSVKQGATTIWERWNSYTIEKGFGPVEMNSFNHYAYGAVSEWMYGYMAGIMYDFNKPGFKNIILQPTPDAAFNNVNCSFDSAYGNIVSNWKYEDNLFKYDTKIPANTTATVYLPVKLNNDVLVNGKSAKNLTLQNDGIKYVKTENSKAVFEAVSGNFSFVTGTKDIELPPDVKVSKITVTAKAKVLNIGKTTTVSAKVYPENATNKGITWKSSNNSVVTVSSKGVVTAKGAGEASIVGWSTDGTKKYGSVTIKVKPKQVSSIKVSVKNKKATVKFKAVKGVKKYTVVVYKGKSKVKSVTANKSAKVTVNKKLKKGSYTVKIKYILNKVTSDFAVKTFKVK